MKFQERDTGILQWVNGFGFASAEQIRKFMAVGRTAAYVRAKKLVDAGYLTCDWVLHGQSKVYRATRKGVIASGDELLPLSTINMGTYRHDLMLVDLALMLEHEHGGSFKPDRRIRHDEGLSGAGLFGHVADGYLYIGEDKPIAIELELSVKSRSRIQSIIDGYGGNLAIKEVWYFAGSKEVARALEKAARGYSFIKIKELPAQLCQKAMAA